jgi:multidrug resistance protein MdtO
VSRPGAISAIAWEDRFLKFLRVELAPTPGRARAAARIVVACVVATAMVMTMHSPHASFVIVTIFVLSQPNAGASLSKALLRVLGTTVGAAVGLAAYIAFLDHPWLRVAFMGPLAAFFLFLSQTTTAPYFGILGGITAIMIMTVSGVDADAGVHIGLWRFAMIALGSVIATAAQLFLWPDDPEKLLETALDERLGAIENAVSEARDGRVPDTTKLDSLGVSGLAQQLQLLDNAEALHPSLRPRHNEKIALIGGVEQLFTAALAFCRSAQKRRVPPSSAARARLAAIAANCAAIRQAIQAGKPAEPVDSVAPLPSDAMVASAGDVALLPGIIEMERLLLAFVGTPGFREAAETGASKMPSVMIFDPPSAAAFFTPAFSIHNTDAIVFSIRSGLAATAAYVIYTGLDWPGLSTSVWTTLLVAQTTLGASVQKGMLRLAGAIMGGLIGLATIVILMPNMDSLTPLLVVTAFVTSLAAWITAGSARISYAGIQLGLAFTLSVLNDLGPTTNLEPARDRVIGVLLGIALTGLAFAVSGARLAGTGMRRSLATSLRSMAGLARVGLKGDPTAETGRPARGWRWKIYQDLTTTSRLRDESKFEGGAGLTDAEAERARIARLTGDVEGVLHTMLALVHHRLTVDLSAIPAPMHAAFQALAQGVIARLEALANRIEGKPETPSRAVTPLFAQAQKAVTEAMPALNATIATHLPGRLALYENLVEQISQLERDADGPPISATANLGPGAAGARA